MNPRTASIEKLSVARDGVVLILATCDTCHRSVLHGLGRDTLANLAAVGTHRVAHCGCGDYTLTDSYGVAAEAAAAGQVLDRPTTGDPTRAHLLALLADGPQTQLALLTRRSQGHALGTLNALVARGDVTATAHRGRTVYTLAAR